jgi:hypothetical protein
VILCASFAIAAANIDKRTDPKIFSKKIKINFLSIKTLKNGPQKLLIISPDPFISQSSLGHSP